MKDVRPTSSRVMLALFSILGEFNEKTKFLDLFSGTGKIGFEALKRGAKQVIFVESVKSRADEIKKNLRDENNYVLSLEIRRAINWLVKREMKFDFIFADPPYNSGWCEVLPTLKNLDKLFHEKTIFIIEHSTREEIFLTNNPYELEIISQKIYGETCLTFIRMINYSVTLEKSDIITNQLQF